MSIKKKQPESDKLLFEIRIHVRIDRSMQAQLQALAKQKDLKVSSLARLLLKQALLKEKELD